MTFPRVFCTWLNSKDSFLGKKELTSLSAMVATGSVSDEMQKPVPHFK